MAFSKKNFVDSIQIEWDKNQLYVPVEIAGKRYRFLFDTGAAQSVVYSDTPIKGCTPAGTIRSLDGAGASNNVPLVILPALTLGNLTITGCQATMHERPVKGRPIDGILGFNIINKGISAKIDVRKRLLILSDRKDFFKHETGYDTRYKLKFHTPYLVVFPFGQYREQVLFDTGNRELYGMNRKSFDACAVISGSSIDSQIEGRSKGRHSMSHFGAEPLSEVVFLHLNQLRTCGVSFCNVHTLTTVGDSHIGSQILNYGSLMINPRQKRIRFQPYDGQANINVNNVRQDIFFISEHGKPCVGLVREKSEPYQRGFRQGDIIVKIDDTPINSFTSFLTWRFVIGREYSFLVKNKFGVQHEIRWIRIPEK